MILFVFEGGKAEPMVFDSIGELFLSKEELCVLKCEHDLPTLYSNLRDNEYDLFRSLPFKENNIYLPEDKRLDTLFSQIFLFFDYDFQNRLGAQKVNGILDEMLVFFSDETENGKLYINYPMIESLKYTKEIPDANYRPILRGRDIKRYSYDWAGLWLIWIPWHFPLHLDSSIQGSSAEAEQAFMGQYPSVYQHLLLYKPQLSARNKAETGIRYEWYALQRWGANYSDDFSQPKIMYPNMTMFIPFYYDEKGFYQNDKSFMITGNHLAYLTAFLNSSLFKFCFLDNFPELQGGTRELRKIFFDKIPVLNVSDDVNDEFKVLVNEIQTKYSKEKAIAIDNMLFDLYDLTKAERDAIGFIEIK